MNLKKPGLWNFQTTRSLRHLKGLHRVQALNPGLNPKPQRAEPLAPKPTTCLRDGTLVAEASWCWHGRVLVVTTRGSRRSATDLCIYSENGIGRQQCREVA